MNTILTKKAGPFAQATLGNDFVLDKESLGYDPNAVFTRHHIVGTGLGGNTFSVFLWEEVLEVWTPHTSGVAGNIRVVIDDVPTKRIRILVSGGGTATFGVRSQPRGGV